VPDDEILNMIAMSYDLVVRKLPRRVREEIGV
jgi:predicted DNA-binding protein (MmcQ/YjbR family)